MIEGYSRPLLLCGRLILGGLVLALAAFLIQIWLLARLGAALRAIDPRPGMVHPVPDLGLFMAGSWVFVAVGVAIVLSGFFLGMARARRMGEGAGLTGYSYGLGWTFGSLFVPLLNLYRPWVGLGEIRRSIFGALETGQLGKKWNRFGDISLATIALAIVLLGAEGLEFTYNLLATLPSPHTAAQAHAGLPQIRNHILVNMAFLAAQAGVLFAYLVTLEGPLRRLSHLSPSGTLPALE